MTFKFKFIPRLVVIGTIIFILISYNILEPEIFHGHKKDIEDILPFEDEKQQTKEQIIKDLIKKFKPDYDYKLTESPWKIAASWVSERQIMPEDTPELGAVLKALSTRPIIAAGVDYKGGQIKMSLYLEGKQRTVFKPKRYSRDHIIYKFGHDRHNGEIEAFHLSRILGFRRAPLVSGRRVNMNTEIRPVGTKTLLDTFYIHNENVCFYGRCHHCKRKDTGVCAEGEILEGTVVLWMPSNFQLTEHKHPWSIEKLAKWKNDDGYCRKVRSMTLYRNGPLLLDIIDTAIFDYLIDNHDRHLIETFRNTSQLMFLLIDNTKSFGNPHHDDRSLLVPLYQCCSVRVKTWEVLLSLQDGILGSVLKGVLQSDPIAPVLTDYHYTALDRRLQIILKEIDKCMTKFGMKVIVTS